MYLRFDKKRELFDLPKNLKVQIVRKTYGENGKRTSKEKINHIFFRINYECNTTLGITSSIPNRDRAIYTIKLFLEKSDDIIGKFVIQINSEITLKNIQLISIYDGLTLYLNIVPTTEILTKSIDVNLQNPQNEYPIDLSTSCLLLKNKNINTLLYLPDLWMLKGFDLSRIGKVRIKHKYDIINFQIPKTNIFEYYAYMTLCKSWNLGFRFFEDRIRTNSEFLIEFIDINDISLGVINLVPSDDYGSYRSSYSTFENLKIFPSHYWTKNLNSAFASRIAEINLKIVSQEHYKCAFNNLYFDVFTELQDSKIVSQYGLYPKPDSEINQIVRYGPIEDSERENYFSKYSCTNKKDE